MSQRLKRWESPRREGRNDKGRGGSARSRQLKKQQQMLRQRLKEGDSAKNSKRQGGEKLILPPDFLRHIVIYLVLVPVKKQGRAPAQKMSRATR